MSSLSMQTSASSTLSLSRSTISLVAFTSPLSVALASFYSISSTKCFPWRVEMWLWCMSVPCCVSLTLTWIDGCCVMGADRTAPCQTLIFGAAMIMTGTRTPGIWPYTVGAWVTWSMWTDCGASLPANEINGKTTRHLRRSCCARKCSRR